MINPNYFYVVVGLGHTGFSCVRYLKQKGCSIAVTDSRITPPYLLQCQQQYPEVALSLGQFDHALLAKANVIVVSPGIDINKLGLANTSALITSDIGLFIQEVSAPIVGITGTNAKSTVTSLVGEMVKNAGLNVVVGGNLGTPALDLLSSDPLDLAILELSSFQLDLVDYLPLCVGTILNITPDHLDRYATVDDYVKAKHRIYQSCATQVINRDDSLTWSTKQKNIGFTLEVPKEGDFGIRYLSMEPWLSKGDQVLLPARELKLKGKHNWANALAALAIGESLALPMASMLSTLKQFQGLPHRCEWVAEKNKVVWINDSKGTNVGACLAALEGIGSTIQGKVILIAGGQGKNADFSSLSTAIKQFVSTLILFGEDANKMENCFRGLVPLLQVSDLNEAVLSANRISREDDCVLLSPACASFDMFNNYEHRGEIFKDCVKKCLA